MFSNQDRIRIGAAGWHRGDWAETVFAGASPRDHRIDRLLPYMDVLEIGSSAGVPPKPELARLWLRKAAVNPRLRMTAPLDHHITHDRNLSPEVVAAWKDALLPLQQAGRLAAVVAEFSWAFRFSAANRDFLIRLRAAFPEFRLAAEFLHDSWLSEEALALLARYSISFVNVDQPTYFRGMPPTSVLTTSLAMVRFHGRSSPEAFVELSRRSHARPYLYSTDELADWLPRLNRLTGAARECLVLFTNAQRGRSLVNALQLGEVLGRQPLFAPAPLVRAYPAEMSAFRTPAPAQLALPAAFYSEPEVAPRKAA